ncbi:sterol desaturase family protein [Aspergillus chevalieri]|uniref:Fatty acid hydroxylase domain-containing protein n=1 Tax=Aspergillus chevalieri TaxID=182096 RepID=A0A7R7ZKW9_ASPCH|nr:uncharacterized protein ACHE_30212A [Aspergillus chevalieri]BCR86225.1 hypothetical protein ACHE_30212A [Aspergillus chevalieri]
MDAILSLPVLSVFLIPTLSSYSTSLNLVFFYMTWSTLVLSHPPLRVELFGTIIVRLIFYVIPSLLFFLFDILTPSAAVVVKAQGDAGLPSGSRRGKIRLKEIKIAGWAILNLAFGIALQGGIELIRTKIFVLPSSLKVSMKLPMPGEMLKDMVCATLGREVLAYIIHRYVLHRGNNIAAQQHQSWYHSLHAPFPLTAHYDHPLAYLLVNFIPTYLPAMLLRFHMLTYVAYLTIVSIEETFAFSGYTVMPTSFFLGGIARRTDIHLLSGAEGNFGPWGIMDWICGTSVGDSIADDMEAEVEEHEIDENIRKAIEASKRRIREVDQKRRRKVRESSRR